MSGTLTNPDLVPTAPSQRTWTLWHIASLWVGMSVCIPSYMLAGAMIDAGIGYSGLLGAVGGVLMCDYLVLRGGRLVAADLYARFGRYSYRGGVNHAALWALGAGVAVAGLGLLVPALRFLFDGAWFSAAIVSGLVYYLLMRRGPGRGSDAAQEAAA